MKSTDLVFVSPFALGVLTVHLPYLASYFRSTLLQMKSRENLLQARPYQVEIANLARNESIIAKLATGLGKTFIAVMVIKNQLHETYRPISSGGKRIIFVAKTVHLVYQHAEFLRNQLPVPRAEIGIFHGQIAPSVWIDSWTPGIWQAQMEKHKILVVTAGVFRDVLNHGKVSLRDVCLLVLDECHHADPDSKSDFTDICQHLHSFPPGKWLPDYSRGPKVLGLSASLVNSLNPGESLAARMNRLERLLRARIVTSKDSSVSAATGRRLVYFSQYDLYDCTRSQEPYYPFAQALLSGVERLSKLAGPMRDDYIDLESLIDASGDVKKNDFLSVMNLNTFGPNKMKRLLLQCIKVLEDYGAYCAAHACERAMKAIQGLLTFTSCNKLNNPQCVESLQFFTTLLLNALDVYQGIRQTLLLKMDKPLISDCSNPAWEDWMKAYFPMTTKSVRLFWLLRNFYQKAKSSNETFSALVLVKERITTSSLAHLILGVSEAVPFYAGFKASYCISANPSNMIAFMSTGDQLTVLDGFRTGLYNILVATNVVEEGLDVRGCNVVIKADDLNSLRSFIQSKGRARAEVSHFVLLTDDLSKCKANVENFIQQEEHISANIEDRCIDKMLEEDEDEEEVVNEDVIQLAKQSYMPFGDGGPRITTNNAASVLMRFIAVLKTDTSYQLRILYSITKEAFGYKARLLLPPPSPLQEIISGPWASNKMLAKQLLRLEACKQLHKAGLLGTDLLPINFQQLIPMTKASTSSDHLDEKQMEVIISKISRLTVENLPKNTETKDMSILSKANLLLVPMEGNFLTDISPVLKDSANILPYSGGDYGNDYCKALDSYDEGLPPGVVILGDASSSNHSSDSNLAVSFEHIGGPVTNANLKSASHSANRKACGLEIFNDHIMDEELPVTKQKNSSRPQNRARFYKIHRLFSLSAPYQQPIEANRTAYLYTWQMPSPVHVAHLSKVDPECFRYVDQTIGFLFSKPISKSEFVCRVPLYMQSGMMRVRLRKVATLKLTENQLQLALSTHQILAQLSVDINKPINFDLNFSKDRLAFFTSSSTPASSSSSVASTATSCANVPDSVGNFIIDPFSELKVDPLSAQICAILVIVKLPGNHFDEEASRGLVHWAETKDYYVYKKGKQPVSPQPCDILLQSGICKYYGVHLGAVPVSQWAGLLVRPINLPSGDPSGFAVSGANADGLCTSSPVPDIMAERVPAELGQSEAISFLNYSQFKYGPLFDLVQKTRGIDRTAPLATLMRISRHRYAANVMSGFGKVVNEVTKEDRIPQFCIVHPLNTWLWLILCLTPVVLYQVYRCISINELENHLYKLVYTDGASDSPPPHPPPVALPAGEFLMPDRHSVPPIHVPSMRKYLVQSDDASWRFKEPGHVFSLDSESALDRDAEAKCRPEAPACLPPTSGLYEALTSVNALEAVNLERLELLGDSFLKFVSSLCLFATSPASTSEGQLTYARIAQISNSNLHRISVKFGLFRYFCSCTFKPEMHYLPPYYSLADPEKARARHDSRLFTKMYDKSIADSVEALLGLFLLNLEYPRVARLLNLFGLSNERNPLDSLARAGSFTEKTCPSWVPLLLSSEFRAIDPILSVNSNEMMAKRHIEVEQFLYSSQPTQPTANASNSESAPMIPRDFSEILSERHAELHQLEDVIGYKFIRTMILLQAITHPSSCLAFKWGCYQRLEFLGDAILDFVVTQRIYKDHPTMDPGQLTDLRIALVSNINLAVVTVRTGIYKFLEYTDNNLWTFINNFCNTVFIGDGNIWKLEYDCNERGEMLSYKVLGDMLEAIIGAVYVDSGGATSAVTGVIYHLLKSNFDSYAQDLPVDPIRLMHEMYPDLEVLESSTVSDVAESQDSSASSSKTKAVAMNGQRCKQVVAEATYKGRKLIGEGYNLRTAKLKIAQQLGIGFS